MVRFAVLQLSGCAGCEVSLLNAGPWFDQFELVYMPLAVSAHEVPEVDLLLVTGGVRTDQDLENLRRAARRAKRVIAVGTCAICGGVNSLGDRDEIRQQFLTETERLQVPRLLPRCQAVDTVVPVDRYLPGCPPPPELLMAALHGSMLPVAKTVCQECGRSKRKDVRPKHLAGPSRGPVDPELCLVNQGYLCAGSVTRGGCQALCTRPGHPCVGCRGPADAFLEKDAEACFAAVKRLFASLTDIPPEEVEEALRSPQLALFRYQFAGHGDTGEPPRPKDKVL